MTPHVSSNGQTVKKEIRFKLSEFFGPVSSNEDPLRRVAFRGLAFVIIQWIGHIIFRWRTAERKSMQKL